MEIRINPEQVSHIKIYDTSVVDVYYKPAKVKFWLFGLFTEIVNVEGYYKNSEWFGESLFCHLEDVKEYVDLYEKDKQLFRHPKIVIFSAGKEIKTRYFKTIKEAKKYATENYPQVNIIC